MAFGRGDLLGQGLETQYKTRIFARSAYRLIFYSYEELGIGVVLVLLMVFIVFV